MSGTTMLPFGTPGGWSQPHARRPARTSEAGFAAPFPDFRRFLIWSISPSSKSVTALRNRSFVIACRSRSRSRCRACRSPARRFRRARVGMTWRARAGCDIVLGWRRSLCNTFRARCFASRAIKWLSMSGTCGWRLLVAATGARFGFMLCGTSSGMFWGLRRMTRRE